MSQLASEKLRGVMNRFRLLESAISFISVLLISQPFKDFPLYSVMKVHIANIHNNLYVHLVF